MKTHIFLFVVCASLCPVEAQWANYTTPNLPRTADGKPNLAAPTPRTAAGKPDFSGLWEKTSNYGSNVASSLRPEDIQPWAQALVARRMEDLGKDHMIPQCLPLGPGYITDGGTTAGGIVKIIQTPTVVIFLGQDMTYRQIYMDGRALETAPNPSWMGYSVGHWEGDTLVVVSKNFKKWALDDYHYTNADEFRWHSDAVTFTEKFAWKDAKTISYEIIVDDPKVFTKPWSQMFEIVSKPEWDKDGLYEYVCEENNRCPGGLCAAGK